MHPSFYLLQRAGALQARLGAFIPHHYNLKKYPNTNITAMEKITKKIATMPLILVKLT